MRLRRYWWWVCISWGGSTALWSSSFRRLCPPASWCCRCRRLWARPPCARSAWSGWCPPAPGTGSLHQREEDWLSLVLTGLCVCVFWAYLNSMDDNREQLSRDHDLQTQGLCPFWDFWWTEKSWDDVFVATLPAVFYLLVFLNLTSGHPSKEEEVSAWCDP